LFASALSRGRIRLFLFSRKDFAMMLTKKETEYGAPTGVYQACFEGTMLLDSDTPRLGRDGRPMPPAMEWRFVIHEGKYAGRIVSRITSREPTAKNSCGMLLDGVMGGTVPVGTSVNLDKQIGRLYLVTVQPSKSDPNRTQVVAVNLCPEKTSSTEPDSSDSAPY
jgi:hypothetical protein